MGAMSGVGEMWGRDVRGRSGLTQCLVVLATVSYWPPQPADALALLAAQTMCCSLSD